MAELPRDDSFDSTLAMLSEGYNFIRTRCARYHSDVFTTRLMLKPVTCALGEDAARMFYHPERFTREGAMPPTTLMALQDKGSVQLQQGVAHAQRKHLFMGLMTPDNIEDFSEKVKEEWRRQLSNWERQDQVELHDEFREILCRAACRWVGISLSDAEAHRRTRELGAMIEGAGSVGPKNWGGLLLRARTERWARQIIDGVRTEQINVSSTSACYLFAWYREDGKLLDSKVAAVELLNLLRPAVAIGRYLTFAALALHDHPECRERLEAGDEQYLHYFVQEVRRFYPFFPFIGGRVQEAFDWRDHHFEKGAWVLLDLYGTNHDERQWQNADEFEPERFRHWKGSAYNFIPQGGGEFEHGHRCPGEWSTIDIIKTGVRLLVSEMRYKVPDQDLSLDLSKMPALPKSGFIINAVEALTKTPPGGRTAKVCPFPERRGARP